MKNIFKKITFTKSELQVIGFIVIVLTSGFCVKYYKYITESRSGSPYDFTKTDSVFRKLSENAKQINSELSGDSFIINDSSAEDETELSQMLITAGDSVTKAVKKKQENYVPDTGIEIININTAAKEELTDLPGVGESTAGKIILYREEKKGFKKPEDIMNVKGIGRKKFEKLKMYIKTQ